VIEKQQGMEVLGAYLSLPESIKDRIVGGPLVRLNACLTFSWPNKVPFDREVRKLFGMSRLPATHYTGAGVVGHGGAMVRPRCVLVVGRPLGTCGSWQTRDFT
jgi:hypothetical protein